MLIADKRQRLESAGWRIGTVQEFLKLSDEDVEQVETALHSASARGASEVRVSIRFLHPEDDRLRESLDAILRIEQNRITILAKQGHGREHYRVVVQRWIPFRWPRWLQRLLAPLAAGRGILCSRHDFQWSQIGTDGPMLRVTPPVPNDYWIDVTFASEREAQFVQEFFARIGISEPAHRKAACY